MKPAFNNDLRTVCLMVNFVFSPFHFHVLIGRLCQETADGEISC